MKILETNYSAGVRKTYFSLEDGDNVYRIIPAIEFVPGVKSFWNKFYRIEFGYYKANGRMAPFACPRKVNFQTKMVEVESAAYLKRAALVEEKKKIDEAIEANPTHPKIGALEAKSAELKEIIRVFNSDSKVYVNAMNLQGQIGLLKMPKTCFDDLDAEAKKLAKTGIDPLGVDNGRFFLISRTGKGRDTNYKVSIYSEKKTVDIGGVPTEVNVPVVSKLTADILARLESECFDLNTLYPKPTPEQVERIVKGEFVDNVMDEGAEEPQEENTEDLMQELSSQNAAQSGSTARDASVDALLAKVDTLPAKEEIKVEVKAETPKVEVKAEVRVDEVALAAAAKAEQSLDDLLNSVING